MSAAIASEREWIERFIQPRTEPPSADGTWLGPGDDAALLAIPEGEVSVLTVDGLVEGTHFLDHWLTDAELAARLIAVTVSDLAAMGATPLGVLLSFETPSLPGRLGEDFFSGLDHAMPRAGRLIGGNIVRNQGGLALTATAIGSVRPERALRRDRALSGQTIAVSGVPGRAGWIRERIASGETLSKADRSPWAYPPDCTLLGRALAEQGVRAAIDTSDGLLRDLSTLLEASGLGADLALDSLALAARKAGFSIETALGGGEDYGLCIVGEREPIERAFAACALPAPLWIGETRSAPGLAMSLDGKEFHVDAPGWDPFRRE